MLFNIKQPRVHVAERFTKALHTCLTEISSADCHCIHDLIQLSRDPAYLCFARHGSMKSGACLRPASVLWMAESRSCNQAAVLLAAIDLRFDVGKCPQML